MRLGFAKVDITPRVGVELCGFGPFVLRRSIGVRDRLWARAMAVEVDGRQAVLVSCDLIGVSAGTTVRTRELVGQATGLTADAVLLHAIHTHSGPCASPYIGWGEADLPYIELLPDRIARAATQAMAGLAAATLHHACVPCEGVGLNREYDRDAPPLADVLDENWRPARPELTDTTCHVLRAAAGDGRTVGFLSYFGCHPVVCCEATRYIHGDFAGVATNLLEREHPGSVGLFLQGAQGDVNSAVVHKPETESLLALDVIAGRYARAVRHGLATAAPLVVDRLATARRSVCFSRKPWGEAELRERLAVEEAIIHAPGSSEADGTVRLAVVRAQAVRRMLAKLAAGESLAPATEVHGLRLGPLALLGAPFEIFQAIRNEVVAGARAPVPLVLGLTSDSLGYAVDHTKAAQGGYAADLVPLICGSLPFVDIHTELVRELLALDAALEA